MQTEGGQCRDAGFRLRPWPVAAKTSGLLVQNVQTLHLRAFPVLAWCAGTRGLGQVAGLQDLAATHDPHGMRLDAKTMRRLARVRAPHGTSSGRPLGHRQGALLARRRCSIMVEIGSWTAAGSRTGLPNGKDPWRRKTAKAIVAKPGDPAHQHLNRGHRGLGKRRRDDTVQKAAEASQGEPCGTTKQQILTSGAYSNPYLRAAS